jgi:hypothetical protein
LFLPFCMDFGIAETGIARGSPPGTTTEVLRFGTPFAEIRVVSFTMRDLHRELYLPCTISTNNAKWERGWFYLHNDSAGLPPTPARC